MEINAEEFEKTVKVSSNITENDYGADSTDVNFFREKTIARVMEDIVSGFKSAEGNKEDLVLPLFERYFSVPKNPEDHETMQKI